MTDDTQDQRLTDAEASALYVVLRPDTDQVMAEVDSEFHALRATVERILAARSVRDDPTLRERIEALRGQWADFEHDPVTCPKYECGGCTMVNVLHDLDAVLGSC